MTLAIRWLARATAIATGTVLALVLVGAATADAHTRTEEVTNIDSRLTSEPVIEGVTWTVYTGGFLVSVENRTDLPLVVEGYDGEPYLRIGPDGVERNRRSPATYLNDDRFGDVALPPVVDPGAPPEWVHLDDEPWAIWHDHRTHWMSPQPPAFVEAGALASAAMRAELVGPIGRAGDAAGEFLEWRIPFRYGGEVLAVEGVMSWHDPPAAWPWLLAAAVLVSPGLIGLRRADLVGLVRPAALMVGLVAAVNGIHLVDDLVAWPQDLLDDLSGLLHTVLFLGVGLGGAVWAWRVESGRVFALLIASGALLYHQGLVHLPLLAASWFPTVWPPQLARLTVALGLVQVVPVLAVVGAAVRRHTTTPALEPDVERV